MGGGSYIRCSLSGLPSDSLENPLKASCSHWLSSCCGGLKFKMEPFYEGWSMKQGLTNNECKSLALFPRCEGR